MTSAGKNRVFLFLASSGGLPSNETTIAKSLKLLNYSTGLFGKWHLGLSCKNIDDFCHHPNKHGFDYFYGLPLTNLKDFGDDGESVIISYVPKFHIILFSIIICGLSIGFVLQLKHMTKFSIFVIVLFTTLPLTALLFQQNIKTINSVLYRNVDIIEQPVQLKGLTDRLVAEASDFIRSQTEQNNPFFVILNFIKVHTGICSNDKFYVDFNIIHLAHAPSDQFEGKSLYGKYGDCVMEMDNGVGQMLDLIEDLNIQQQTFTYFSSDNGGHLEEVNLEGKPEGGWNGIFRGGKGHGAMEGGIRVPTVAMWPGVLPSNRTISVPTTQMDIFTTIHSIVNLDLPTEVVVDGKNIFPLLQGHIDHSPHRYLFHYCGTYLHAVRYIEDSEHVWKTYFFTPKYKSNQTKCEFVCMCYGQHVIEHKPPLVFNIAQDTSESFPIKPESDIYERIVSTVLDAAWQHKANLTSVPSQFSLRNSIWKPWLQPCCNFPRCQC